MCTENAYSKKALEREFQSLSGRSIRELKTIGAIALSRCRSLGEAGFEEYSAQYGRLYEAVQAELSKREEDQSSGRGDETK